MIRITRAGIKTVARFVVARAVSTTISLIIEKNTEPEKMHEIASVHIGSFVIGEWVGDAIKPYIDEQIDSAADSIESARKTIKELSAS
jgi:hypothetical protein